MIYSATNGVMKTVPSVYTIKSNYFSRSTKVAGGTVFRKHTVSYCIFSTEFPNINKRLMSNFIGFIYDLSGNSLERLHRKKGLHCLFTKLQEDYWSYLFTRGARERKPPPHWVFYVEQEGVDFIIKTS